MINITYSEKSYEHHSGKLLLLTPDLFYYIEDDWTIISSIQNIKNIDI